MMTIKNLNVDELKRVFTFIKQPNASVDLTQREVEALRNMYASESAYREMLKGRRIQ